MLVAWLIAAAGIGGFLLLSIESAFQNFRRATPSPGAPGEGRGEGDFEHQRPPASKITLTPTLSRSSARGGNPPGSERVFQTASGLLRLVSSISMGLGAMSLLTLGLGLAGLLHHGSAVGMICGGIVLAVLCLFRLKIDFADCMAWLNEPAGWNWLWISVCPFAAIALVAAMLPSGILWRDGDPSFYDVVEYHLQVPREWFEAGRIIPLPHNVFSFFPLNVEMHYLLAMHLCAGPWAAMFLAQLVHLAFIALFVVAVYAFALEITTRRLQSASQLAPVQWHGHPARADGSKQGKDLISTVLSGTTHSTRAGSPRHGDVSPTDKTLAPTRSSLGSAGGETTDANSSALPAITAALAVATVPWLTQLAPVAYDEGGFLLFGTLAIAWVCRAVSDDAGRNRGLVIGGAFAGFACGAKLTAVPQVLVAMTILCGIFLIGVRREPFWRSARAASIFLAVGLLVFSPWLIRNERWAGNPVFPQATTLLGPGNFTPVQIERWQRAHSARPDQRNLSARLHAGASEILGSRQYGYVLIPLGVIAAAIAWRRRLTVVFAGMFLATALFWLFATHLEGRFFVLALPVCAWLIAQVDRPALAALVLLIVLGAASMSGVRLHHDISTLLHGGRESPLVQPTVGLLGVQDISGLEANYLDGLSPGQSVVLIGDAKAFFYTIPMSQLHYRTVFDVRTNEGDLIEDWNGGPIPHGARVIVDPGELKRFHDTYWKIPAMSDRILQEAPNDQNGRRVPFVMASPRN